jgi:serine/threonine-protein kinase
MIGPSLITRLSLFRKANDTHGSAVPESSNFGEFLSFLMGTAATFVGIKSHFPPPESSCSITQKSVLPPQRVPLRRGQKLGHYHLLRRLGQGAQGDVWKALQLGPTVRMVAIKIMNSNLRSNPIRLAQFQREAARGARLSGPSLLPISETGEIDGYVFMAMPYVEGISLKEIIIARRAFEAGEPPSVSHPVVTADEETYIRFIVHALAKASRALALVHENRVVHRDIKPANLLLDLNRTDCVYLCDFGLGRELDVATSEQLRDGSGTPMFMAPERLLREPADEVKCDIYSMGVTLFEALTLKRPFQVPESASWPVMATFLATTEPSTPSQVRPGFPQGLEAIIRRAMSRDPEKRYRSADEMADDLIQFQACWAPHATRSPNTRPHAPHSVHRPHFTRLQEAG